MGAAKALYTRGSMEHGPGVIIKRVGGFNSPIWLVMGIPFRGLIASQAGSHGFASGEALRRTTEYLQFGRKGRGAQRSNWPGEGRVQRGYTLAGGSSFGLRAG